MNIVHVSGPNSTPYMFTPNNTPVEILIENTLVKDNLVDREVFNKVLHIILDGSAKADHFRVGIAIANPKVNGGNMNNNF